MSTQLTHSVHPREGARKSSNHALRGPGIGMAIPVCGRSCGLLAVVIRLQQHDQAHRAITCTRCRVICAIEDRVDQLVHHVVVPAKGVARAKAHTAAENKDRWDAADLQERLRHAGGLVIKAQELLHAGLLRAATEQAELAARFLTNDKGDD